MKVKMISFSQPSQEFLEETSMSTMTDLISFCARVSNPQNQMNKETSEKLIRYLIKNKHWSPLETVSLCLEVETTRDIARQFLRHRSFSFQEFCVTGDSKITTGWYDRNNKFVPHYISIENLYKKQKWKNYKDILIRVFDESQNKFVTSTIKEVFKTGIKPVYKLTLEDGKQIECTKEHKFLSTDGWDTLENISGMSFTKSGKIVLENPKKIAVNGDICYQNKEWLFTKKQESIINKEGLEYIANEAGVKISTIRKWLKKHNLQYTKKEVSKYPELAFDLNNVIPVHRECHQQYHGKNASFMKESRSKSKGNTLVPRFVNIKSIEFMGNKETYDLEVDHISHNYVANKICVHNSQRYADPTKDLSFVLRECRFQDEKNRQNSIEMDGSLGQANIEEEWLNKQRELIIHAREVYQWAMSKNIAKEQSRCVLPEGNTVSRMCVNGTLRSWIHYIDLRSGNGTQKEHKEIALACAEVISKVFPMAKEFVTKE